ncbi:hypothetical protein EZL74_07910 [Flavobacterium silvisoli]|uniref:Uncharacterized protein n=1 Tax=Flavobacterium silvisoli TaxID=2529433 RepID=A0A4Q9YXX8_9FLAO|nr:hypothetical protein [Flavobacterium silvisoli]TBX68711.1 hypothetical protein EZL74_07910 [Flavobacterium silvisoli]
MKQLILIAAMILAMTAKLLAQDQNAFDSRKSAAQNEPHQFGTVTHKESNIHTKCYLKAKVNHQIHNSVFR